MILKTIASQCGHSGVVVRFRTEINWKQNITAVLSERVRCSICRSESGRVRNFSTTPHWVAVVLSIMFDIYQTETADFALLNSWFCCLLLYACIYSILLKHYHTSIRLCRRRTQDVQIFEGGCKIITILVHVQNKRTRRCSKIYESTFYKLN